MRIRLKYPDVETFVEKYSSNISEGGMFIQSRAPQPVGTQLRFDLMLHDGTPLLKGEGTVIWVKEYDAAHPQRVHGMGVRFGELDDHSRGMVDRIVSWKLASAEPLQPLSHTQEVQALVRQAATEDEEPDASVTEPHQTTPSSELAPTLLASPAPEQKPATLFAALLDEARRDDATASPPPLAEPARPQRLPAPPSGDGVRIALENAEQMLSELLAESGVGDEQIEAAREWVRKVSLAEAEAELQSLCAAGGLAPISVEEAVASLPRWSAPVASVPAVAQRPPAAAPPPQPKPAPASPVAPPVAPPLPGEDFDPALLQAAARTARASKQVSGRSFDVSDGDVTHRVERLSEDFEPLEPSPPPQAQAEPPPDVPSDPGWGQLRTKTELLDHDSSRVLRDLAQRTREHRPASEELAVQQAESPTPPDSMAVPDFGADPNTDAELAAGHLESEPPPMLAEDDLSTAVSADDLPPPLEPEESSTERSWPIPDAPLARGASAEALSREVWREVVNEVSGDLGAVDPATEPAPADSFFEGAIPEEAPLSEDDADALELDPREMVEATDDEALEEDAPPPPEEDNLAAAIFSDADLGAIDAFGEYQDGAQDDRTVVTDAPAFVDPGRRPAAHVAAEEARFQAPVFDETEAPESVESTQTDPLEDFESEPFDKAEEVLRPDPDLEDEVFEALAGLRDTLRDGDRPARKRRGSSDAEPVPDLADLAGRAATGTRQAAPADQLGAGEEATLADQLGAGEEATLAGETDPGASLGEVPLGEAPLEGDGDPAPDPDSPESPRRLRPRRSGLLKRLFGKKE
jgi:uncharacterized protein (TIGR02266 family)